MRKRIWLAVQVAFAAAAFWFVGRAVYQYWADVERSLRTLSPSWALILASAVLVLGAYVVLIQTWRVMLGAWEGRSPLAFGDATRIWFVSNLGRYVPGKIWQIAAMSALAQQRGVSPVAATGSALIVNLANVLSGFVVALAGGVQLLDVTTHGRSGTALVVAAVLLAGMLLLPVLLPPAMALAGRVTGRLVHPPRVPARSVWAATVGTAVAWALYGTGFALLAHGILPGLGGGLWDFIAVYTVSYLAGYLFVPAPGGLGVREWTMVQGLTALGIAGQGDAWTIAFVSRLWLTVLEAAPGVVFLLVGGAPRPSNQSEST
jgi:uncharacterized membrane protein YbhN (UPF0104 family)